MKTLGGKSGKVLGVLVAAFVTQSAGGLSAEESRGPSTIIVYGDASGDWLAEVERSTDLLDPRDQPVIVAGDTSNTIPDNSTLVWFGDLSHNTAETKGLPAALRTAVDDLGRDVSDQSAGPAEGEVRIGANCYTRHIDRADGLPEIAVNFSGDDPQDFCKGLTVAHLLGRHGRWMRNDGTECMWRDCETIIERRDQ